MGALDGVAGVEEAMASGNAMVVDAMVKCRDVLSRHRHARVSVSGGADSDVMLDLVERVRVGLPCEVTYVWFDTGIEYAATRRHLDWLEGRYGVAIMRRRARKTIPACCREYGQPFLSKYVSEQMGRLQAHGFDWSGEPYEELSGRFPRASSALKWWCDRWTRTGEPGWFDVGRHRLLREFVMECPPWFPISNKCCTYAKKEVAAEVNAELGIDVELVGIRRAEGGARGTVRSCYSAHGDGRPATYRPLLWLSNADRAQYRAMFGVRHSDCYERWGFSRTGCVGCPFNRDAMAELAVAERHEPGLVGVARRTFADAYEYTRMYRDYVARHGGQMSLGI